MSEHGGGVDLRGFDWPLAALEKKLAHDLDRARVHLATLDRQSIALDRSRHELAQARATDLQQAMARPRHAIDPQAYRRHLEQLLVRDCAIRARGLEAEDLHRRVGDARQACIEADRRLASLRSLKDAARGRFALEQARRTARQADLAWLALRQQTRANATRARGSQE